MAEHSSAARRSAKRSSLRRQLNNLNKILNNLKNLENFTEFSQNFAQLFPKIVTTSEIFGPVREIPRKFHQNLDEK